jgi:hypothetical protein
MAAVRRVVRDGFGAISASALVVTQEKAQSYWYDQKGDAAQAGVPGGALLAPSAEVGHDAPTEDLEFGRAGQRGRACAVGGGRAQAAPGSDVRLTNDAPGMGGYVSDFTMVTGHPYTDRC